MVKKVDIIEMHRLALRYAFHERVIDDPAILEKDPRDLPEETIKKAWETHGVKIWVAKQLGISKPTLFDLLEKYPTPPKRIYAHYEDFYMIPTVQSFIKTVRRGKQHASRLLRMWKALDRKNPEAWTEDDYLALLQMEEFHDPLAIGASKGKCMHYNYLEALRAWCKFAHPQIFNKYDKTAFYTKEHKRVAGKKRLWYLTPTEIRSMLDLCEQDNNIEMYHYIILHWKTGARFSGLKKTKWADVILDKNIMLVFEPKTQKQWTKIIDDELKQSLMRYIERYRPNPTDSLLKYAMGWYNFQLKVYATKAGISKYKIYQRGKKLIAKYESGKAVSTHILRHSFAYLCSINGLSLEMTAELGGWDDLVTLKNFYYPITSEQLITAYQKLKWDRGLEYTEKAKMIETKFAEPPTPEELKELEKED